MEKQYFSYIRVSTTKQGERGVSLQEQQSAILRYAERQNIRIVRSFEEMETAAKRGRPIFNQMLSLLKHGKANGVVIHKIDRGARNLKDWADLGELIDAGVEVHFANESLDLNTRGGRLSADIQAVVAADFIRNLREETKKGFYGRLKQGFYPLNAPLGYLDRGGGQAKVLDVTAAIHIRDAFDLYATGNSSLPRLMEEMYRRGMRNRRGGKVSLTGMSTILNNPFYIGVIRIRKTGESFAGVHAPIVNRQVFEIVQRILEGKTVVRTHRHEFAYSRMIRCALCTQTSMAEVQKGHTYYRCHTRGCQTKTIREERIEEAIAESFAPLQLNGEEVAYMRRWFTWKRAHQQEDSERQIEACNLQLSQIRDRLSRLKVTTPETLTDIQRAARHLYLLKNSYGSMVVRQNYHLHVIQPPGFNVDKIPEAIGETHKRLARVQIECLPYEKVLKHFDRPETLFYLDPPYFGRSLYRYNLSADDFTKMAERLAILKGKFILSLNDVPEVRKIFGQFKIQAVDLAYSAQPSSGRRYKEVLITNF
jgi:DNA invertase Pin-like site-specific DNA recombinase